MNVTDVDAWVTFLTPELKWGGSLNQAIAESCGPELEEYILHEIYQPKEGQAFITPAFAAPVDRLVVIVLPEWEGGFEAEDQHLARGYKNAVTLAANQGLHSIAFPSLGGGRKGFPQLRAARIALYAIGEGLKPPLDDVRIVCKDAKDLHVYSEKLQGLMQRGVPL